MKSIILIFFTICFLSSCSTTKTATGESSSNGLDLNKVESLNNNLDLTQELRRLPGVQIVGEGEAAAFQIRGVNSFTANTSPLFVVDGQTFEDYATVYRLVAPANFRSARVLKSSSDLSMYGVRGSNGVIVIKTK